MDNEHVYAKIIDQKKDEAVKCAIPLKAIRRLKELDLSLKPSLDFARDMFLFSFYTTEGMSFIDMAYFKKSDLHGGALSYCRKKTGQLMLFMKIQGFGRCSGISFVDSTMIPVCHSLRRYANKVFKGVATDGKVTMGWCHGFKLHLMCNDSGKS